MTESKNSRQIKFGPSGNSNSFYAEGLKHTTQTAVWLNERGLTAFEYSFGRGVKMRRETAEEIGGNFKKFKIEVSAHAPYYINFANTDAEKIENSISYITETAKRLQWLSGTRCVFHPGSTGEGQTRGAALKTVLDGIKRLTDAVYRDGFDMLLFCPETMGKIKQIGDHVEIAEICKIDKIFVPTVDFGHLNARTKGGLKTEADFDDVVSYLIAELGYEKINRMHIHFSKIQYGNSGEIRHLTLEDKIYGPEFLPLAKVLKKHKLNPVIISESDGTQAEDALEMKRIFEEC